MAESEEAFERVFEFSVQETLKDLSQNGKHIVLTPMMTGARSCHWSLVYRQDVLAIHLSNTRRRLLVTAGIFACRFADLFLRYVLKSLSTMSSM